MRGDGVAMGYRLDGVVDFHTAAHGDRSTSTSDIVSWRARSRGRRSSFSSSSLDALVEACAASLVSGRAAPTAPPSRTRNGVDGDSTRRWDAAPDLAPQAREPPRLLLFELHGRVLLTEGVVFSLQPNPPLFASPQHIRRHDVEQRLS